MVEIDEPAGGDGVIAVHAAGVAFLDALLTRGLYRYKPELPFTPGAESPVRCAAHLHEST